MKDIFISHSSSDRAVAEEICKYLGSFGFDCWISCQIDGRINDLEPGCNYPERITAVDCSPRGYKIVR
jgi:hypothetical protein